MIITELSKYWLEFIQATLLRRNNRFYPCDIYARASTSSRRGATPTSRLTVCYKSWHGRIFLKCCIKLEALELNREAWEADGVILFDRRVAVQLAVDEAEKAEEAKEQLLRSISREPRVFVRDFKDETLMAKHVAPRISAKAQKSLCSAIDGLDDNRRVIGTDEHPCDELIL